MPKSISLDIFADFRDIAAFAGKQSACRRRRSFTAFILENPLPPSPPWRIVSRRE